MYKHTQRIQHGGKLVKIGDVGQVNVRELRACCFMYLMCLCGWGPLMCLGGGVQVILVNL